MYYKELKEGPKSEIQLDLLRLTLKKVKNWQASFYDVIHKFWFKRFTTILIRLAQQMQKSKHYWVDEKKE